MKIDNIYSPNFSKTLRKSTEIRFLIIHYTGMQSKRESIKRLTNIKSKVSCHYLIDRKGKIIRLVADNRIAWHAGKSKWGKHNNLNSKSIGIELVNKGHKIKYENFTNEQISSLIKLLKKLKNKFKINKNKILGHSDIAPIRKIDPGEKFPWGKLSKNGLALNYPKNLKKIKKRNLNKKNIYKIFFKNLYILGYRYFSPKKLKFSQSEIKIIKAFQRRFFNRKIDGKINQKMLEISGFLAKS